MSDERTPQATGGQITGRTDPVRGPLRDRVRELVRVPAGELLPNPKRWRTHPEAQRRALQEILDRVGITAGLLARRTDEGLVLLDGHLRQDLAADAVVPVLVVDLDPDEGDLVLATFDPVGEMAKASHEALAALVRSTAVPKALLESTLRRYPPAAPKQGMTDPDAVPSAPRSPRVRTGELWALGDHRVGCGDATDPDAVRGLVGEERIDVVFTDPPYGVEYTGKTKDALTIANDAATGLRDLLERSFASIDGALSPGARIYVCHPAARSGLFADAVTGAGWRLHQILVWVKDRMVLGHTDYHYRHEPILYGYKPGPGRWGRGHRGWFGGDNEDSVLEIARPSASREHPTAKPVELVRHCLENSSGTGELVLDPFGGSGSTLIAAEQLDRRCFLLELEPRYADVAITRWEEFTGSEAVRVDG